MKSYFTLRFERMLSPAEASALAGDARTAGCELEVRSNERFARTYALVSSERDGAGDFAARYEDASRYADPLLALSIEPQATEALRPLAAALTGSGAPEGVLSALIVEHALLIEFFPARTSWRFVRALIDVELARYGSTVRRTMLLSPVTADMEIQIAADGLQEPELNESRVLEALLSDADR